MNPTLEITTIVPCLNACKFCPQDVLRDAYQGESALTFESFKIILKKVPRNVRIDFSAFSEPFRNFESSLMMRHANRMGYKTALFSTLVGFTGDDLNNIKGILFSPCVIHAPDDFNFIRNEYQWTEAYKLLKTGVHIDEVLYHIGEVRGGIVKEIPDIKKGSALTRANNVNPDIAQPVPRKTGIIGCWVSGNQFNQNVLLPNGDIYLCCMDYGLKHKLGNLFTDSYEQLHQSEAYQRVLEAIGDDSKECICRYCVR